jgi:hypothetical protein
VPSPRPLVPPASTRRLQPHDGIVVPDRTIVVFHTRRILEFMSAEQERRLLRSTRGGAAGRRLPSRRAELARERIWPHWQSLKDARQAVAELAPAPM